MQKKQGWQIFEFIVLSNLFLRKEITVFVKTLSRNSLQFVLSRKVQNSSNFELPDPVENLTTSWQTTDF